MTKSFSYSTTYVLDKSHFSETFDESALIKRGMNAYAMSFTLTLLGLVVLYVTDISPYLAWFLVGIGAVEALSVRFKKPWWLARQMLSKAASHKVTLTIDEQGVGTTSRHVNSTIAWSNISEIKQTERGWLLYQGGARSYLSNRCLSDQAVAFIRSKAGDLNR